MMRVTAASAALLFGISCVCGLSSWIPYYGTGIHYVAEDFIYAARSYFCPSFTLGCDVRRDDIDWAVVRKAVDDWRKVAPCMLGDFYPLTPYSLDRSVWMAWQFDLPAERRGVVQVFRRPESPYCAAAFPLHRLDPQAIYEVTDLDAPGTPQRFLGKTLLEEGLSVALTTRPATAVIAYVQIPVGQ